jgi:hypothetical protein
MGERLLHDRLRVNDRTRAMSAPLTRQQFATPIPIFPTSGRLRDESPTEIV